ncbi:MAG: penicillin-binding transpeptidase domain-containing protein, partial [Oscillospiraceae bacterium]|nr:penicillin-binding transpeptidase domain-containing protein [Oscillospiraceae bacterium]
EILALPTYPSYNLLDLKDTVKYAALAADNDNSPLLNRALFGRYAPGSIFKIATSVAALCSGNLTTTDQIEDKGVYMRYANADGTGYTPACWLWNMNHTTHGWEDITKAIRNSCNYFFFVVADRMGINKIDEYAKHLGLGEPTGIELGEDTGILSSPEYAGANGKQWSPGQVLATAIGQSYNVFTPLQMVTMLGAVLDDGTRYASHLLLRVEEYGSDDNIYSDSAPKIMDQITIPDSYLAAIKQGMYEVFETGGTASTLFQSFPSSFTVGGKTGTAQINEALVSDNATCVAFAPFDKPEIAISSVIEKGAKGAYAGYVAEDVCAYYFGYKTFNESMDLPDEPTTDDTTDTTDVGN